MFGTSVIQHKMQASSISRHTFIDEAEQVGRYVERKVEDNDYNLHSPDTEPPDMEYQNILFQATELIMSSKFQLELIMDAYQSSNWTDKKEMKALPEIFNKTIKMIDKINRTLERKTDSGYYFIDSK